jgi:hypothetical protein
MTTAPRGVHFFANAAATENRDIITVADHSFSRSLVLFEGATDRIVAPETGDDVARILGESMVRTLALHGLVPQAVARSENVIVGEWSPRERSEQTYRVRAIATGETLAIGTPGSVRYLGGGAPFEYRGLEFILGERSPAFLVARPTLEPHVVRYFVNASPFDPTGRQAGLANDSTEPEIVEPRVDSRVENLLSTYRRSRFQPGMESHLSRELQNLFSSDGKATLIALAKMLGSADANVVAEALRTVSRIEDPRLTEDRRWLLEAGLSHRSPLVRDVAVSGLSVPGSRRSISALKKAIAQERIETLRSDMEELVDELEEESGA